MNGLLFSLGAGRWSLNTLKGMVTAWLVGEILAFCLALKLLGLGMTLLVMFGTSVVGVIALRRVGLGTLQQFRRAAMARSNANANFIDGSLTALGAVLLILPGFVSDAFGLMLVTPSLRQRLASRFLGVGTGPARAPHRASADVIDLAPEDWRVVDKTGRS